ncbi:drug resistance transporter, EmrB/QacA subfamily [Marinobacter daqiaonensis]|uniref:Drug resistance transporter, EmrB/QacA subfamily n=1 Tax=Marinobacter daqiaonensis TaxID=650891 RepID=A0A1I6JD54_9GAMM|nr:DHA2 family efflux MFS transporter permease subunit [Marinobacter daqiaonensis]SFR76955.1 drug resistance transporter, EmrB/QacA subfamily [Marinobacter daqiaonensis]
MSGSEALQARYGSSYKWLGTCTVMLGTLSMTLATTIVNVAIPDIMGNFGIAQTKAQWLSTGFLAAMAAFMLVSAWALQRFGMKAAYIGCLGLFMLASVIGGMSPHEDLVILSRVAQGAMAGVIQPLAMTMIFQVFPERQRGLGMGIYGLGVILGPAIGPAVGGVLVDWLSWRAVFFMPLPTCLLAIGFAIFFAPGKDSERAPERFDWPGFAFLCLFLISLLWSLSNGQRLGWHSVAVVLMGVFSLAMGAAFIVRELKARAPLLNLKMFRVPGFAGGCAIAFCFGAGLFGSTYLIPLFVQQIQGLTATAAGLMLMPAGLAMALVFPLAGHMADRFPAPQVIALGTLMLAGSNYLLGQMDAHTLPWIIVFWVVLGRLGLGFGMPAIGTGSLRALDISQVSQGSGAANFSRQLGGAIGVNLLSVILEWRTVEHARVLTDTQTAANVVTSEWLSRFQELAMPLGVTADQLRPAALAYLQQAIQFQAYIRGFQDSFLILAGVFLVTLVPIWVMHRYTRRHAGGKYQPAEAS